MAGSWTRDPRIDLLRGLCVAKMVFDHLAGRPLMGYQSWIGPVTAAEGFFLLSGVSVGIVYRHRLQQHGLRASSRVAGRRAVKLYTANLILVLAFVALELAGLTGETAFRERLAAGASWGTFLHFDQPYFLQVLPRYVAMMLLVPAALWLLQRGLTPALLAASLSVWALHNVSPAGLAVPGLEPAPRSFPLAAWQLVFFAGVTVGYHRERLGPLRTALARPPVWIALVAVAAGFVALDHALRTGTIHGERQDLLRRLLLRRHLGPLLLVDLAAVSALLYLLVDRLPARSLATLRTLLEPLGRNALYVFLLHIPLVWVAKVALQRAVPAALAPTGLLITGLVGVLLLAALAQRRVLFRIVPR